MVKFLRRTWNRYSKLGKGRKKKQVWRKPKGRDNKMREKRKGYPAVVSIGYKKGKKEQKKIIKIDNIKDLEKVQRGDIAIIGNVGKKKKIEIAKKAKGNKIQVHNLNVGKFLKNLEKKKPKTEEKERKTIKKSESKEKAKKEKK